MIELQHVSKYYGSAPAVDDISFTVQEGETLVLLGTSGCGKTTTLRMMNRLIEPTTGSILLNGKNIVHQPAEQLRRSIGYVLQHTGLFPHFTIFENIATVPRLLGWPRRQIAERMEALMHKLHLDPSQYGNQYPHQLSGGQQQRVGLARALAADPPLLLMDEPFGALDPVTRTAIRKEIKQLDELKKKTIVLVTHDVQEAFELADKICLMNKGKIVQAGTPAELLFKPASDFVTSFLSGQRFLLELQSITLNDVWSNLASVRKTFTTQQVPLSESLWHTLQLLSGSSNGDHFYAEKNSEQKVLHAAAIMEAFHQYKTSVAHE